MWVVSSAWLKRDPPKFRVTSQLHHKVKPKQIGRYQSVASYLFLLLKIRSALNLHGNRIIVKNAAIQIVKLFGRSELSYHAARLLGFGCDSH
jgi:hypothetical protein